MAWAFDTTSSLDTTNITNPSWSHTCTGSNLYLVVLLPHWANGNTVSGVTYNGVAMSLLARSSLSGSNDRSEIWGLANPATGSHTVAVTGANCYGTIGAASFTGIDQTTSTGTAATATGSSTGPTVNTSSASNEVVVGAVSYDSGTSTTGGGQTPLWNVNSAQDTAASYETGAATTTTSWTIPTAPWAIAAVPLKPSGAAASTSLPPPSPAYALQPLLVR